MRIVVVEDEAPIREGLSKLLSKLDGNYELVGKAENGKKGLEVIRKEQPDLVIMDIRMPEMDGLTMLACAREEGIRCKAVVLSAYSEFDYAKQAIELGVEKYLLKPIKVSELEKVLSQIQNMLLEEENKKEIVNLDYIFLDAVTGRLDNAGKKAKLIEKQYGIKKNEELVILAIGLEDKFGEHHALARTMVQTMAARSKGFQAHVSEIPSRSAIVLILWQIEDENKVYNFFQTRIIPALSGQIKDGVACMWGKCNGIDNIRNTINEMNREGKWNLLFEKGKIISKQAISERVTSPFKYPVEIEDKACTAVVDGEREIFMSTVQSMKKYFLSHPCTPEDVQGVMTRGLLRFVHIARETGRLKASESMQPLINRLVTTDSWEEIQEVFQTFFDKLSFKNEDEARSVLIKKAKLYIEQYYNQGITLEEIAEHLYVSEEYLSSQFRKETGKTFSETIKKYRIEHIKELLIKSSLKMNQIADMVGYSDSKYMSKVFKEEVGMLPTEYRKINGKNLPLI